MPKVVDADVQRREIRRAAHRVFTERGVKGVGLAHVAREAGIGRSSIYHYYADKTSLLRDVVTDLLAEEEAMFAAAAEGEGDPLQRIEKLTETLADLFGAWSTVGGMFFELCSIDRKQFARFFRRARAHLARLIEEGQRRGQVTRRIDPRHAAAIIIGALDGLLLQYLVDPPSFRDTKGLRANLIATVGGMLRR